MRVLLHDRAEKSSTITHLCYSLIARLRYNVPVLYDLAVAEGEYLISIADAVQRTGRSKRTLFSWLADEKKGLKPYKKRGDQQTYLDLEVLLGIVATTKPGRRRSDSPL